MSDSAFEEAHREMRSAFYGEGKAESGRCVGCGIETRLKDRGRFLCITCKYEEG